MLATSATPNHQTTVPDEPGDPSDEAWVTSLGRIGPMKPRITVAIIAIAVPIRTGKIALESDAAIWQE